MYSYIVGKITKVSPKYIVLESNGIGYELIVANPYNFKAQEDEQKVYVYQHVREDSITLFGFKEEDEKELFLKLISVNGIGPKSALSILASATVKEIIMAIESRDDKYLKKFPGIGPKASLQIILDLKGKVSFDEDSQILPSNKLDDLTDALTTLGYTKKDSQKALAKIDLTMDEGQIIREALKLLNK